MDEGSRFRGMESEEPFALLPSSVQLEFVLPGPAWKRSDQFQI